MKSALRSRLIRAEQLLDVLGGSRSGLRVSLLTLKGIDDAESIIAEAESRIPPVEQLLHDVLVVIKIIGASGARCDLDIGDVQPIVMK